VKLDRNWNAVRAYKQVHGVGKVVEKLKPVTCTCGMSDFVWEPVEPPEPGQMWMWKCPDCHSLLSPNPAPRTEESVHVRGDWEPFLHPNMGHDPVLVKSRAHFKELCRLKGLSTKWG